MKILTQFFAKLSGAQKKTRKTIKEYQQEVFVQQSRDQIKKLLKLGQMPVTFL